MKNVLFILLGGFLCGCYTNKIVVIDSQTLQPVPDALVLTDKQYPLVRYVRAYKTNKNGVVHLDYQPTSIFAGKPGYWIGSDKNPNVVFLVPEKTDPSQYAQNKDFPSLYAPYEYLSTSDPLYGEWKPYAENQKQMKREFLRNKNISAPQSER